MDRPRLVVILDMIALIVTDGPQLRRRAAIQARSHRS
jgi:hypothetical protein